MTNSMNVEYDEAALAPESIIQAVVQAGYGASCPPRLGSQPGEPLRGRRPRWKRSSPPEAPPHPLLSLPDPPVLYLHGAHDGRPPPHISWWVTRTPYPSPLPSSCSPCLSCISTTSTTKRLPPCSTAAPTWTPLIAVGSIAAVIYGVFAIYQIGYGLGHGDMARVEQYHMDLYFESAGMILTLITLGKFLETRPRARPPRPSPA